MPNYILAFRGGQPSGAEEGAKMMQAWNAWIADCGAAMYDAGSPFGPSLLLGPGGERRERPEGALSGYAMVAAADRDEAADLAARCPIFEAGGTIEVAEALRPMQG